MKTRIIHTKLWQDTYFSELNNKEKLFFIYLISNEYVNICGAYEVQDRRICFDTSITDTDLQKIKEKLQKDGRFIFIDGWVKITNIDKYNNYRFSERNEKAFNRELQLIPEYIREIFGLTFTMDDFKEKSYQKQGGEYVHRTIAEKLLNRKLAKNEIVHHLDNNPENNHPTNLVVMDKDKHQQLHSGKISLNDTNMILVSKDLILAINKKQEIRNNKSNNINDNNNDTKSKKKETNNELTINDKAKWVLETFNEVFGKKLKSHVALTTNLQFWLESGYTANDIKNAIKIAKYDEYWRDKLTPVILLRRKNTRGEDVDYIGQFLAKDQQYKPRAKRVGKSILEQLADKGAK